MMIRKWLNSQTEFRTANVLILCVLLLPVALVMRAGYPNASAIARRANRSPGMHVHTKPVGCSGKTPINPIARVFVMDGRGYPLELASVRAKCHVVAFLRAKARDFADNLRILHQMQQETSLSDVAVFVIVPDSERDTVQSILDALKLGLTPFYDLGGAAQRQFDIRRIPTALVFDEGWNITFDGRNLPGTIPMKQVRQAVHTLVTPNPRDVTTHAMGSSHAERR